MKFKKIDQRDVDFLTSIVGEERIFTGEGISEDFGRDELVGVNSMPEVLVEPISTEETSKIMKYAYDHNIPVTPRGQGTGLVGASIAIYGGIMMNMSRMNNILELDEENLTVTVEPGLLLMELTKYVESHDLFYPPDPGEKSATLAGNISTNAGGMRAVKYGVTRDYIRGLELVLPNGEIMEVGGKIVKNSSGYGLKDLIVGSEGTLAVVTKATLRLLPLPKKMISLLVPFERLETAIETVPKIIKSKNVPTAIEYMVKDTIMASEEFLGKEFPDKSSDAYLLLSFDGNSKEEVENAYEVVADICLEAGAIDVLISETAERQESIWSARGAFLEAIKSSTTEMDECDVVVPRNNIAEFVKYSNELKDEFDIRIKSFGHAGDGNLHIYILRDDLPEDIWKDKLDKVFQRLYDRARELKGQVSGEHGIGFAKKSYLEESLSKDAFMIMKGIKSTFDPKGILNPGKIS